MCLCVCVCGGGGVSGWVCTRPFERVRACVFTNTSMVSKVTNGLLSMIAFGLLEATSARSRARTPECGDPFCSFSTFGHSTRSQKT